MSTISQTIAAKAAIVADREGVNYQTLTKPLLKPCTIKHIFFISHASSTSRKIINERQPLDGESNFVKLLVEKLEKYKANSTYVDYRDNPNLEFTIFHTALKSSQYGVFVCSPRFKDRYMGKNAPFLKEEVKHFWTLKNTHHQPERQLPISFGLETSDYDSGPFSSSDFMIVAEYGKIPVEQIADKVVSKIIEKTSS